MVSRTKLSNRVTSSAIIAFAVIISACIVAFTWHNNIKSQQTIAVTGSAKRDIVSDIGILRGAIQINSINPSDGYALLKNQMPVVLNYLTAAGIKKEQIEVFPITSYANYEYTPQGMQTGRILGYTQSQRFQLKLNDVQKIKTLSLQITDLLNQDIALQMDAPEYYYSGLADLKIQIQADAAKDAQTRAMRIAESTEQSLGAMRGAKMGVLQITPKNSNIIGDYGINDVSSIEKEITAVVHANFEID
jgi:hypothetical protein